MAYDSQRERVVLFGGWANTTNRNDTWEWNGTQWTFRTVAQSPPARYSASMAYDAARQRVVLFGGTTSNSNFADTWEWDGQAWTNRPTAVAPEARAYHAMAYDAARQRVVLFGGDDIHGGAGRIFNDTWEWDGTSWTQVASVHSPPPSDGHSMTYDSDRGRVVMYNGGNGEVWEWDGIDWTQRTPSGSPPSRSWFGMTYDVARERTVVFGGAQGNSGYLNDTWELTTG